MVQTTGAASRHSDDEPREWLSRSDFTFGFLSIGIPAVLSVLRLWVEAGGDLQTTLLLVENVPPLNLVASLIATATWFVTAVLVAVFAVGGVLNASDRNLTRGRLFLVARWSSRTPPWLKVVTFVMAALTWQILFLPLLGLAACAAFQVAAGRSLRWPLLVGLALGLVAYLAILWPTLSAARTTHEYRVIALLVIPAFLAVVVAGPLLPKLVLPIAIFAHVAAFCFFVWAGIPLITEPVLPLSVVVQQTPAADGDDQLRYLRGHVVNVDDRYITLLRENGGIQYILNDEVVARFLCPASEELPMYGKLNVHGFRVEDSVLRATGRRIRPAAEMAPACRAAPYE
ncbi:hypothetical protein [Catellatospora tritici]|uniref:hypothetical protein n=1 Tax=Catellatospora tritici TaxID=2851566 RepID=UPI001C2D8DCD|nr:hypothetical protein [Catellatospora tritici]MBV1852827.1 hypothetical protein [Catellatospora tritici]